MMTEIERLQKENEALRRQVEELKKPPVVNPADFTPAQKLERGREANHREWLRKKGKL